MQMQDPASSVPQPLLPHVHLVSTYRFPVLSQVSLEKVVDFLQQGLRITRDVAPMHWQFLDAPSDGSLMLVWQPLNHMNTHFASDGYIWADAEQMFTQETRGYTVEMYVHRSGYRLGQEHFASHSRKRYRLMPSRHSANSPQCDPALFMVHYTTADPQDRVPVNSIRLSQQVQASLNTRHFLQNQGRLVRSEFMLYDRAKWPQVNLPGALPPNFSQAPAMYQQNMLARMGANQRQSMYHSSNGPPAKRLQTAAAHSAVNKPSAAIVAPNGRDPTLMDEEDYSLGDAFDFLTPREISSMRYKQHHEWVEEVFSSAYTADSIIPVDLGLGRKGELESLTRGFFNAPTAGIEKRPNEDPMNRTLKIESGDQEGAVSKDTLARIGRMEDGKADDFAKCAEAKIASMNIEMEKMQKTHKKRLAKLQRSATYKEAEKQLRIEIRDPIDTDAEPWRITGHTEHDESEEDEEEDEGRKEPHMMRESIPLGPRPKVDDVVKKVEKKTGKHVKPISAGVVCVRKGVEEEKAPSNTGAQSIAGTVQASEPLNQALPSTNAPQEQNTILSSSTPNTAPTTTAPPPQPVPTPTTEPADITMTGTEDIPSLTAPTTTTTDDWVVIPKDGIQLSPSETAGSSLENPPNPSAPHPLIDTPGAHDISVETPGDLDMNTAGDALAAYDSEQNSGDLGEDLGAFEDSAFADAFHGTEGHAGEGGMEQ
ncbi:MAG: hypothetical protein M1834_007328 [Cirrosporium novae-zelandiae]|nr:MAG: hypothetical protein M1834_007328 [Cirrosporium novae-zelandiae]